MKWEKSWKKTLMFYYISWFLTSNILVLFYASNLFKGKIYSFIIDIALVFFGSWKLFICFSIEEFQSKFKKDLRNWLVLVVALPQMFFGIGGFLSDITNSEIILKVFLFGGFFCLIIGFVYPFKFFIEYQRKKKERKD